MSERPVSSIENLRLALAGEVPYWAPVVGWGLTEIQQFRPRLHPDNMATHLIMDGEGPYPYESNTSTGLFGLDWVFVPHVGGATVRPGKPLIEDMNDWEKLIQWPNLDEWDFEGMAEKNKEYLSSGKVIQLCILDSFWERLISLMDVSGAAMALIDEDQKEAVHAFFDKYADFLIDYISRVIAVCKVDCVLLHDDWGTQNGPFFSPETGKEMILPYIKRVIDFVHSKGMVYEQHSCGNCTKLAHLYVEAGVDFWCPQPMNDFNYLVEMAQGTCLHISLSDVNLSPEATEEEVRQAAKDFFDRYDGKNVLYNPRIPNPAFEKALYEYSSQVYAGRK